MAWSERQRRMLAEMGLPPWLTPAMPKDDVPAARADAGPAADAVVVDLPSSVPPAEPQQRRPDPPQPRAPVGTAPAGAATSVALRSGLADIGWDGLRATVESCTACSLCQGRTQTVFGVGHPSAHWMVVGEAPGEQEDRQGEPFVGRSGQLLDNMLRALGLTRAEATPDRQVYIANTLKCRPPGNRNPTPEELATCEPFLIRQVALVQPRVILAMGRFAVQSLLRSSEPIGRLRGRVHQYQGVPLVVTYHPAYLLRNPLDKSRAWDDLCLAAATLAAANANANTTGTGTGVAAPT